MPSEQHHSTDCESLLTDIVIIMMIIITRDRRISIRGQIVAKKLCAAVKTVAKQSTTGCHDVDSGADFFGHDAAFHQNSL